MRSGFLPGCNLLDGHDGARCAPPAQCHCSTGALMSCRHPSGIVATTAAPVAPMPGSATSTLAVIFPGNALYGGRETRPHLPTPMNRRGGHTRSFGQQMELVDNGVVAKVPCLEPKPSSGGTQTGSPLNCSVGRYVVAVRPSTGECRRKMRRRCCQGGSLRSGTCTIPGEWGGAISFAQKMPDFGLGTCHGEEVHDGAARRAGRSGTTGTEGAAPSSGPTEQCPGRYRVKSRLSHAWLGVGCHCVQ